MKESGSQHLLGKVSISVNLFSPLISPWSKIFHFVGEINEGEKSKFLPLHKSIHAEMDHSSRIVLKWFLGKSPKVTQQGCDSFSAMQLMKVTNGDAQVTAGIARPKASKIIIFC